MPDCDYCGASFDDEDAYLSHLGEAHEGELGRIDRRRAAGDGDEDGGIDTAPIVLGGVILVAAAIVGYVIFFTGGGGAAGDGAAGIGDPGSAHYHGTVSMTVLGESVDFSREQYQLQDRRFHFEDESDTEPYRWHAHATGVTLAYGMDSLGIEVTADSVTYRGTTYRDNDSYAVEVTVNGEPVDPAGYVLEEGDRVRIVVRER